MIIRLQSLIIILLSVLIALAGFACNPKTNDTPQDVPDSSTPIANDDSDRQPPVTGLTGINPPGYSATLTMEDLANVTGYGVFVFPFAELNSERSRHDKLQDGTEQYILQFTCEASIDVVADWFLDNLEPGYQELRTELAPGREVVQFSYQSENPRYMKNIVIQGMTGIDGCELTVNLLREPEESTD